MRIGQTALAFLVAFPALVAAGSARADAVQFVATGTISASCSLTKASDFASANLAANGSVNATATVNCNTGFTVTATSAKGAIKRVPLVAPPANFTNSLPYAFALSVPLDSGGPAAANCASAAMLANSCSVSSGSAVATNKTATLTTSWTAPVAPAPMLVAGSYSDTITLSIAAAP